MEILPSEQFESHSQSANGLKRPFGVKNDTYGPCHGADFYKNDTLSWSRNPENDTLFSGTSPYGKIYEYPPPALPLDSLDESFSFILFHLCHYLVFVLDVMHKDALGLFLKQICEVDRIVSSFQGHMLWSNVSRGPFGFGPKSDGLD